MAYPFRPMKKVRLRKLDRKREDPNLTVTVFNRPPEFETDHSDFHQNKIRSSQELNYRKITTDKIISQPNSVTRYKIQPV
jgi:hypothetical protein